MKCAGHFHAFPAHHKPLQPLKRLRIVCTDALCCNLAPLSEVVIGNVEPTMSCVSCETRCKYMKILPIFQRKRTKITLLWFSGLQQYAFGDYSTWKKGKRYGQTGRETACNRERDGM